MLADGDLRATFVPARRHDRLLAAPPRRGAARAARRARRLARDRQVVRPAAAAPVGEPAARLALRGRRPRGRRSTARAASSAPTRTGCRSTARSRAAEDWDVTDAGAGRRTARGSTAALDYGRRDDRLAVVPLPAPARARRSGSSRRHARRSRRRSCRRATSEVPLAFGWHPWLSLPGVPRGASGSSTCPRARELALDDRSLPTGERAAARRRARAARRPRARRPLRASPRTRASRIARRRARDRGRVGRRLPLRAGLRAADARRRLPRADDGAGRRALHRRGARARASRAARERDFRVRVT